MRLPEAIWHIGLWSSGRAIVSKTFGERSIRSRPAIYLKTPQGDILLLEKDNNVRELSEDEKYLAKDLKAFLIRNKVKLVRWKSHGHVYFTNDEKGLCVNLEALADEIGVKEI